MTIIEIYNKFIPSTGLLLSIFIKNQTYLFIMK